MDRNNLFISKNDKAIRALFQDDEKQYVIKIAIKYYFTNKIDAEGIFYALSLFYNADPTADTIYDKKIAIDMHNKYAMYWERTRREKIVSDILRFANYYFDDSANPTYRLIKDAPLPEKVIHILTHNGFQEINDILVLGDLSLLLKVPGLGRKSMRDIQKFLGYCNLLEGVEQIEYIAKFPELT